MLVAHQPWRIACSCLVTYQLFALTQGAYQLQHGGYNCSTHVCSEHVLLTMR